MKFHTLNNPILKILIGIAHAISALFLLASNSYAVNCNMPINYSEQAICVDPLLISMDAAMTSNYKFMFNANLGDGARNDLRVTQRNWMGERGKCRDKECILTLYKSRLSDVCDYPVIDGVHPICSDFDEVLKNQQN